MGAFATPQQMEDRTGGLIASTHPFLVQELDSASQAIRNYCGWHIAGVEEITYKRTLPYADQVFLPAMHIQEIVSATVDGVELDVDSIEFDKLTGWTSIVGRKIEVTFNAGFEEAPDDLVTLTLELAASALASPLNISREQAGGVSVTLSRVGGGLNVGTGSADTQRLAPYKLGILP